MTAMASPVMVAIPTPKTSPKKIPGLMLLPSSILVFVFPGLSRSWVRVPLWRAGVVAFCNAVAALLWGCLVLVAGTMWSNYGVIEHEYHSVWTAPAWRAAALALRSDLHSGWATWGAMDRWALVLLGIGFVLGAFLLPFFVILPFGARPGPNKPCLKHVARTVMLGSGMVHWWGAAYTLLLLTYASRHMSILLEDYARAITPLLLVFFALSLWTLIVLILAVRHDYRTAADLPEPHDPWCDDCGYSLTGIDHAGRCPECGRLISDSLGPQSRSATAWEARPRICGLRVIGAQIWATVLRPRSLFFSMPTQTGQGAAQKWLLATVGVLFVLALPIVPAIYVTLEAEWNFAAVAGSLAMGLAWAVFGMMMVGVETAGIATFSRLRRQKIYLATSAKVTAYSAILMAPWVVLGGIQLVAYTYCDSNRVFQHLWHLGVQGQQVALALSLAVAHIGGLLWYEITVYRGIRAVQFANK